MSDKLEKIADCIKNGDSEEIAKLTQEAVDEKVSITDIMQKGLFAGMDVVGERFKNNDMFIPEVLRSAKAMHASMDVLRPLMTETDTSNTRGTVVMATVQGDLHDIGKNLVGMMLEGAGFNVIDIGIDQPTENIIAEVKKNKANFVGLSALLTTTMPKMGEMIEALKSEGLRDQVKVMIGGAPVTEDFKNEIGADIYAPNASIASELTVQATKG
ncbi:MAG: corrinoid protein [Desulfobia sp.]